MSFWLWGSGFAFLGGGVVGGINFLLSRQVFRHGNRMQFVCSVLRQILQIGYLIGLYLISPYTPWSLFPLLMGGVLGLTFSLVLSTWHFLKVSRCQNSSGGEKQEEQNG